MPVGEQLEEEDGVGRQGQHGAHCRKGRLRPWPPTPPTGELRPGAAPEAGLRLSRGPPTTGWDGTGGMGGTWSDGLQQEGHRRWEAEDGGQVERVQQQPRLLRQGTLGGGGSTQPGPTPWTRGLPGELPGRGCSPSQESHTQWGGWHLPWAQACEEGTSGPGSSMRALLTTARRFSTWKAATAKALATEDRGAQGGSGPVSPPPPKTLLSAQLTNNQAQGGPAVGVL